MKGNHAPSDLSNNTKGTFQFLCKEIMLELNDKPSSVTTFSTDFSFQNLVFGIYLNFQQQKSFKNQYLPHSESKAYQINFIKSCSSRSFQ
jgi:hypothetical protein